MDNLNSFSVKKWYKIFITIVTINFLILGLFGFLSASVLNNYLNEINESYVPILKSAMKIDMLHDGLRGNVVNALYLAIKNAAPTEKDEITNENKEFTKKFNEQIEQVNNIQFDPEIKKEFASIVPIIKSYIESGSLTINYAFTNNKKQETTEFEKFGALFKTLEEKLDKFSTAIHEKVSIEIKKDNEISGAIKFWSLSVMIFFVLFTIIFSYIFIMKISSIINNIVSDLFSQSQTILSTAGHLNDTSRELNIGTQNQNVSLQKTATAAQEINSMIIKTSESSEESSKLSKNSEETVHNGEKIVLELIACIDKVKLSNKEIMTQVRHGNDKIKDIIKVIAEISNKTKVINDIVFKTKLLSFNASVEAARAGDHGRGFSVVAEEVGNLAKLSGDSAKEINLLLSESIEKVESIIHSTTSEVDKLFKVAEQNVNESTEIANQCSEVMQSTVANVIMVNKSISEIATAAKEQEFGISEIVEAISQLEKATQSNAVVAEQTAKSGNELTNKAHEITVVVETLRQIMGKNKVA